MASTLAELFRLAVPAVAGLGGVWIGANLNSRSETKKRRYEFIAQQLSEFYAPLLGIRMEILGRSELRVRISEAANTVWRELCADQREIGVDALKDLNDRRGTQFAAIIDHDNQQLRNTLMPAYRKMIEIFRDKLWLAESETRSYFPALIEFIEIWERYLAKSLPGEVIERLGHTEENLQPFYDHLQDMHDQLRNAISSGNV